MLVRCGPVSCGQFPGRLSSISSCTSIAQVVHLISVWLRQCGFHAISPKILKFIAQLSLVDKSVKCKCIFYNSRESQTVSRRRGLKISIHESRHEKQQRQCRFTRHEKSIDSPLNFHWPFSQRGCQQTFIYIYTHSPIKC